MGARDVSCGARDGGGLPGHPGDHSTFSLALIHAPRVVVVVVVVCLERVRILLIAN
jgi:hypothetical protein